MFCIHCGMKLPDDEGKFCPGCGAPIDRDPVPVDPQDYDNSETQVLTAEARDMAGRTVPSENSWQENRQSVAGEGSQPDSGPAPQPFPEPMPQSDPGMAFQQNAGPQQEFQTDFRVQGQNGGTGSYYDSSWDPETPRKFESSETKKSKLPFIIGGAIAVVVIALIAVVVVGATSGVFKRAFSSPESYYQYVEQKNIDRVVSDVTDYYGNAVDSINDADNQQASAEISVQLEDGGRALAGAFAPIDLSWLEKVTLKGDVAVGDEMGANLEILLNEDSLATLQYIMDGDTMYVRIPELSQSYLSLDMAEMMYEYGMPADTQMFDSVYDMYEEMPEADALKKVMDRYTSMAINHVTTVEKAKGKIVLDDITQTCTRLDVTITAQDLADLMLEMIPELQKDEDLEEIIRDLAKMMQTVPEAGYYYDEDTVYNEFLDELADLLDEVEEWQQYVDAGYVGEETIDMTIWVNGKDEIVGRTVAFDDETLFEYYMPMDGDDYNLYIAVPSEEIVVSGSGTKTSSVLSGDFDVTVYGEELFTLNVKDFSYSEMKDQKWSGTFTFTPSEALLEEADMDIGISTFALRLNCEVKGQDSSSLVLTLMNAQTELVSIAVNAETTSKAEVPTLSSSDQVYNAIDEDEVMEYLMDADWDALLDGLRNSDLPAEYVSYAEMYVSEMQEMFSYYSYY